MKNKVRHWMEKFLLWAFPSYILHFINQAFDQYNNRVENIVIEAGQEYGRPINYWNYDKRVRQANLWRSVADAIVTLPPGTVFSLREKLPTNFGRNRGVTWYLLAGGMDLRSDRHAIPIDLDTIREYQAGDGYIDHGLYITPGINSYVD